MASNQEKFRKRMGRLVDAATHIGREYLAEERELTQTKWFEYRFMSPWEATLMFAGCYRNACQSYIQRNIDLDLAKYASGITAFNARDPRQFTQMWLARQRADELGMPYARYLEFCFKFAERRTRRMAPRPNQLHGTGKAMEVWARMLVTFWEDWETADIGRVELPQFRIEHFKGLDAQIAMRKRIVALSASSLSTSWSYIELMSLVWRLIPPNDFATVFDPELVENTVASFDPHDPRHMHAPRVELDPADFLISCFGVPGAHDPVSAACTTCKTSSLCSRTGTLVEQAVYAKTGAREPQLEARRARGRDRTQRCRAKAKARMAGVASSPAA